MKNKPAITLFALLVIGIIAFLFVSKTASKGLSNNVIKTHVVERSTEKDGSSNADSRQGFDYQPEKPVNGIMKGVVEIGATGFNSFVIWVDSAKRWEVVAKDFGTSLVYEGLATTKE